MGASGASRVRGCLSLGASGVRGCLCLDGASEVRGCLRWEDECVWMGPLGPLRWEDACALVTNMLLPVSITSIFFVLEKLFLLGVKSVCLFTCRAALNKSAPFLEHWTPSPGYGCSWLLLLLVTASTAQHPTSHTHTGYWVFHSHIFHHSRHIVYRRFFIQKGNSLQLITGCLNLSLSLSLYLSLYLSLSLTHTHTHSTCWSTPGNGNEFIIIA